ncbi:MAG: hypothetical protein JW938_05450 [Candidatus Omnitrophica bacterium]|nr:hypothetical protein [Candidatus Omnitrophota bacterium]
MNTIGIIDIGSNTVHCDVFRTDERTIRTIGSKGVVNRLGVHLAGSRTIPAHKITEAVNIIRSLMAYARNKGARTTHVFATSILRKAANRKTFIHKVKAGCGADIDVISTGQECLCVERAARFFIRPTNDRILLVDIGGGSTEFIIFDKNRTYVRKSYAYGLSYVKGRAGAGEVTAVRERARISRFFDAKVRLFAKGVLQYKCKKIIVTSSIAKVMAGAKYGGMVTIADGHRKTISRDNITALQKKVLSKPHTVNIAPAQRELVYIGTYFFHHLLQAFHKKHFYVGPYSVREGYVLESLELGSGI